MPFIFEINPLGAKINSQSVLIITESQNSSDFFWQFKYLLLNMTVYKVYQT